MDREEDREIVPVREEAPWKALGSDGIDLLLLFIIFGAWTLKIFLFVLCKEIITTFSLGSVVCFLSNLFVGRSCRKPEILKNF